MKICVLLPDEPKAQQAGLRIRYLRMAAPLRALGHDLALVPVQNLTRGTLGAHDVYLLSKCYDARALVALHALQTAGKRVGADFFDDYFSQVDDSRFARLRYWFRQVLARADFALCSTPRMHELVAQEAPGVPVHLMNDPAQDFDAESLRTALALKLEKLRESRLLTVLWFGIGDNPNFPVGLQDLAAFGNAVDRLRHRGFAVHLKILTNPRAMTAEGIAALRRLATEWHLEAWSEPREAELLTDSLVAFLPVNAQNFSIAKSLNRAVTALSAGTQVLSAGYPLYAPLEAFVYRDPMALLADLADEAPRLRPETASALAVKFTALADPAVEADRLSGFLGGLPGMPRRRRVTPLAVIHGRDTLGTVHKLTQRLGGMSVASPLTVPKLHFDLRFSLTPDGADLALTINEKHAAGLKGPWRRDGETVHASIRELCAQGEMPATFERVLALLAVGSTGAQAAAYPQLMKIITDTVHRLYPDVTCFHSEQARELPWQLAEVGRG